MPPHLFTPAAKKVRLVTANKSVLAGGNKTVTTEMACKGERIRDGELKLLGFPTTLYEADIAVDAILSFKWLRDFNLDVRCGAYGLKTNGPPAHFFIEGCPPEDLEDESPQIQAIEEATVAQITKIKVGELKQEATPPPDKVWVGESQPFWQEELYHVRQLNLRTLPELAFEDEMDWETCLEVAKRWPEEEEEEHKWTRSVVVSHDPVETEQVVP